MKFLKPQYWLIATMTLGFIATLACTGLQPIETYLGSSTGGVDGLAACTLNYNQHIVPILRTNCTSCHGGATPQSGFSLENYGNQSRWTLVRNQVENRIMPPVEKAPLSADEISLIRTWVNMGAPETLELASQNCNVVPGPTPTPPSATPTPPAATPTPLPGSPGRITEFLVPTANSNPHGMIAGPDGAIWFTEAAARKVGRITMSGQITEYDVPINRVHSIVAGPDGAMWFAGSAALIGRLTVGGALSTFPIPAGSGIWEMTVGPDNALWFTNLGRKAIGRMTLGGAYSEFLIPNGSSEPKSIQPGPDGNLWFADAGAGSIFRITTAGVMTEFRVPTPGNYVVGIAAGADGAMWFTETGASRIGRITMSGQITEFITSADLSDAHSIKRGKNGMYFTARAPGRIGLITLSGVLSGFSIPTPGASPALLAEGPDGNIWFVEYQGNRIGRLEL